MAGFLGAIRAMLLVILSWLRNAMFLVLKMKVMKTTLSRLQVHYLVHVCGASA
jgi:hypothetical protein